MKKEKETTLNNNVNVVSAVDLNTKLSLEYIGCPHFGVKFKLPEKIEYSIDANGNEILLYLLGKLFKLEEEKYEKN